MSTLHNKSRSPCTNCGYEVVWGHDKKNKRVAGWCPQCNMRFLNERLFYDNLGWFVEGIKLPTPQWVALIKCKPTSRSLFSDVGVTLSYVALGSVIVVIVGCGIYNLVTLDLWGFLKVCALLYLGRWFLVFLSKLTLPSATVEQVQNVPVVTPPTQSTGVDATMNEMGGQLAELNKQIEKIRMGNLLTSDPDDLGRWAYL